MRVRRLLPAVAVIVALVLVLVFVLAPSGSSAPSSFSHRTRLADCGVADLRPGKVLDVQARAPTLDCFARARMSGTGAELYLRSSTTEGARSDRWLRTLPDGTIEEFAHTEGDQYGPETWSFSKCTGITTTTGGLPMASNCVPVHA